MALSRGFSPCAVKPKALHSFPSQHPPQAATEPFDTHDLQPTLHLAGASRMALLHDTTLRCKGWCQEEQTLLQVRVQQVAARPHWALAHTCR